MSGSASRSSLATLGYLGSSSCSAWEIAWLAAGWLGWANTVFTSASTAGASWREQAATTLRRKCTVQRCQLAPAKHCASALRSPSWVSELTSSTPCSPRATRERQNSSQNASVSLAPTATPRTHFSPVSLTSIATTTAWLTIRPPWRTFSYVASNQTYG